ncbi:MAG: hypothetical protein Q9166_004967 [cf. Caloplaca sp. 2 TL-2023]
MTTAAERQLILFGPPEDRARWQFGEGHIEMMLTCVETPDRTQQDEQVCNLENVLRSLRRRSPAIFDDISSKDFKEAWKIMRKVWEKKDNHLTLKELVADWEAKPRTDFVKAGMFNMIRGDADTFRGHFLAIQAGLQAVDDPWTLPERTFQRIFIGRKKGVTVSHTAVLLKYPENDVKIIFNLHRLYVSPRYDAWYLGSDDDKKAEIPKIWATMIEEFRQAKINIDYVTVS